MFLPAHIFAFLFLFAATAWAQKPDPLTPEQRKAEAIIFTAPGFTTPGEAKWDGDPTWSSRGRTGEIEITVREEATGKPTPCRINVVGPDGNF